MKKFVFSVLLICVMFLQAGCLEGTSSTDVKQEAATEKALKEAHSQIGMPAIKNFQERKLAKMVFELRDQENLITYAYLVSLEGKLIFFGKCIGFGLPYSVQYTNPMKTVRVYQGGIAIPQADPNGLFMPSGLSATWLNAISTTHITSSTWSYWQRLDLISSSRACNVLSSLSPVSLDIK